MSMKIGKNFFNSVNHTNKSEQSSGPSDSSQKQNPKDTIFTFYKCIKTYPSGPSIGDIFKITNLLLPISLSENNNQDINTVTKDDILDNIEYFMPITDVKDYEIEVTVRRIYKIKADNKSSEEEALDYAKAVFKPTDFFTEITNYDIV